MDDFLQQTTGTQKINWFSASLRIFGGVFNWLAGLSQLTEEEQEDAGIYLG